jgi:hypothetical protein
MLNTRNFPGNGWRAGYREIGLSGSEEGTRKPELETDQGAVCLSYKTRRGTRWAMSSLACWA